MAFTVSGHVTHKLNSEELEPILHPWRVYCIWLGMATRAEAWAVEHPVVWRISPRLDGLMPPPDIEREGTVNKSA